MRLGLLVVVLLLPALGGCLGPGADLVVVAQAPRLANGISIALAAPRGLFASGEGTARYHLAYNGQPLWPPGGIGAQIEVREGKGSAFVPYNYFVVENGDYQVVVDWYERRFVTQVSVEKWVNWVYALPYLRDRNLVIDLVLVRTAGQPNDRVFAEGQLNLEIHYRGGDGREDRFRMGRTMTTDGGQSFQRITVPLTSFDSDDRGYYSVEATFHNYQANGNNNVPLDPTLSTSNPPTNWFHIR